MMPIASIALSGLQAQSTRLHASAHNVANLLTDDFKQQRISLVEQPNGGVLPYVERIVAAGPLRFDPVTGELRGQHSNTDLVAEVVNRITSQRAYEANLAVIEAENERIGHLLDSLG